MHILKKVGCMTSFPAIHFFYDSVIISREHLKQSACQRNCVYYTTLVATIHYNGRSVLDSRKIEEYVYLRKTIVALLFLKVPFYSTTNFCLKSTVLNAQKHLQRSYSFMVDQHSKITFIFQKC